MAVVIVHEQAKQFGSTQLTVVGGGVQLSQWGREGGPLVGRMKVSTPHPKPKGPLCLTLLLRVLIRFVGSIVLD